MVCKNVYEVSKVEYLLQYLLYFSVRVYRVACNVNKYSMLRVLRVLVIVLVYYLLTAIPIMI